MTERQRRRIRRDAVVFLASVAFHVGLFFIAASEFNFYVLPQENAPAVQVEIVPQAEEPPPPPMPPIVRPTTQPTEQPPPAQPQPQPPKPTPTPPQPAAAPAAAVRPAETPAPLPAPKAAPSPTPVAAPPQAVPKAAVAAPQATAAVAAPHIVLHKSRNQASALGPTLSLPGATFAPPPMAAAPGGGAPTGAGGHGGGLPEGALPGFGSGLRSGPLACANALVLHLSAAEQARCDEAFGEGALQSPRMDPIGAAKREELDTEAATEDAARKYRDSTPTGSSATPIPGQPRMLHPPGQ